MIGAAIFDLSVGDSHIHSSRTLPRYSQSRTFGSHFNSESTHSQFRNSHFTRALAELICDTVLIG